MVRRRPHRVTTWSLDSDGDRPAIEIRASSRRTKSASARMEDGRLVVLVPAHLTRAQQLDLAEELGAKVAKRQARVVPADAQLHARALELAPHYIGHVAPTSVRFVTNQQHRFGSCSPATGEIRISSRLRGAPTWVIDVVLIHELCHLVHPDHSPAFHALADRAPRRAEAELFLEGVTFATRGGDY